MLIAKIFKTHMHNSFQQQTKHLSFSSLCYFHTPSLLPKCLWLRLSFLVKFLDQIFCRQKHSFNLVLIQHFLVYIYIDINKYIVVSVLCTEKGLAFFPNLLLLLTGWFCLVLGKSFTLKTCGQAAKQRRKLQLQFLMFSAARRYVCKYQMYYMYIWMYTNICI